MEHLSSRPGCFYFDPRRDVLWLSLDFTDEPEHLRDLQRFYGEQLRTIQTLLVEEEEWAETTPAQYTSQFLGPFCGLETVLVLLEDANEDVDEDSGGRYEDTKESGGSDHDIDENSGDSGEDSNQGHENEARELLIRARGVRAEYEKFPKDHEAAARNIRCVNRRESYEPENGAADQALRRGA